MKHLIIVLLSFISTLSLAQDINKFDVDGARHGIWKKYFDGTKQLRYEGEFNHGKEIGLFNFYMLIRKKSILTATKQYNKEDNTAYITFLSSRGRVISEGEMNGKLYIGEWTYYHNNSTKVMTLETYNNDGKLDGKRLVYYENGKIAEEANYISGSLEGVSTWYSKKGVILKDFRYENNELHGISKYYDEEGVLLIEGSYKQGKKTGIWRYFEEGKLVKEKDFTYIPKYNKKQ